MQMPETATQRNKGFYSLDLRPHSSHHEDFCKPSKRQTSLSQHEVHQHFLCNTSTRTIRPLSHMVVNCVQACQAYRSAFAASKGSKLPNRKCCMMGNFDSTSARYILIMPLFTCTCTTKCTHWRRFADTTDLHASLMPERAVHADSLHTVL